MQQGRVVLSRMEEVQYGRPAAEAVPDLVQRFDANRVFLMVSGTLNRETDEAEKLRKALGSRCAGTFDCMPAHTPRGAVIAAAEQARDANADLIVTLGGGSVTDGAKAVQLCLSNDIRTRSPACARAGEAATGSADFGAHYTFSRRILRPGRRNGRTYQGEGVVRASRDHPARGRVGPCDNAAHANVAVPLHRRALGGSLCGGHLLQRVEPVLRCVGSARPVAARARSAAGSCRCIRPRGAS